jgi:hypothetical protein
MTMNRISIAILAAFLSLSAATVSQAYPTTGDDTNRYENKSTGG